MAETSAQDSRIEEAGFARIEVRVYRHRGWRRASGALAIAGLVGIVASVSAAGQSTGPAIPVLNWQPCAEASQQGFDCVTAQVPLDYSDPRGATVSIGVIRHSATDPANRLGAIFYNQGGPGATSTALPGSITFFPAALRARFDIISWDPRGAGANEVQCFATAEDQDKFFAGFPMGFPVSEAEQRTWIRGYVRYGQLCAERNGDLLAHVSTVDTANDLDLLRQAVGESQLNYWGLSYGTFLGAIYANLFPDKLRALVLDGNVDPVGLTNGGNDTAFLPSVLRFGSDKGTAKTLDAFLTLCGQASTAHCAFSAGSAAATKTKWAALLRRLHEHPINVDSPPRTYTYAGLITLIASDVGVIAFKALWPQAAELLQSLWTSGEQGAPSPAPVLQPLGPVPPSGPYNTIRCGEVPNPRNTDLYPAFAALAYARSGDVGPAWVWRWDETCASWPVTAAHRYGGPWNRPTANPILVINNTYDSETPYEDAVAMVKRLARARLLTVDGYGHTVFANPSTCANDYVSRYFIDGTLPPEGTVCRQDQPPFATGP